MKIRVVKPPSTAEQLDALYQENEFAPPRRRGTPVSCPGGRRVGAVVDTKKRAGNASTIKFSHG